MGIWIPGGLKSESEPEPYVPPTWSDGTDEEIAEALEKHYAGEVDLHDYWGVGDKRNVTLSAMEATNVGESHAQQSVTYVLSHVGGKYLADGVTECCFQVDQVNSLNETGYMNSSSTNYGGWISSARRAWCNSIYKNAIPSTLRSIFKEFINRSGYGNGSTSGTGTTIDTFALRAEIEVTDSITNSVSGEGTQVTWYQTSSNRCKKVNSNLNSWWERSPASGYNNNYCYIITSGASMVIQANRSFGISPFGVI